jgi:hypothetical protein
MGWPGRREVVFGVWMGHGGCCIRRGDCPCERLSTASSQTPPPRLRSDVMSKRVLSRVSSTQRDALDARCEAPYSGGRRPTELIYPSTHPPTPQTRHQPEDRCGPGLHRGVWDMSGAWWSLDT